MLNLLLFGPRRIARATGATVVVSMADMEGNETFDASCLGTAEEVVEERVADDNMVMIKVRESEGSSWEARGKLVVEE